MGPSRRPDGKVREGLVLWKNVFFVGNGEVNCTSLCKFNMVNIVCCFDLCGFQGKPDWTVTYSPLVKDNI